MKIYTKGLWVKQIKALNGKIFVYLFSSTCCFVLFFTHELNRIPSFFSCTMQFVVNKLFMNDLKKVVFFKLNQETLTRTVSECQNFRIEMRINAMHFKLHECNFKITTSRAYSRIKHSIIFFMFIESSASNCTAIFLFVAVFFLLSTDLFACLIN